jgi:hypothetical protein
VATIGGVCLRLEGDGGTITVAGGVGGHLAGGTADPGAEGHGLLPRRQPCRDRGWTGRCRDRRSIGLRLGRQGRELAGPLGLGGGRRNRGGNELARFLLPAHQRVEELSRTGPGTRAGRLDVRSHPLPDGQRHDGEQRRDDRCAVPPRNPETTTRVRTIGRRWLRKLGHGVVSGGGTDAAVVGVSAAHCRGS